MTGPSEPEDLRRGASLSNGMSTDGMDPESDEFKTTALFDAIEGLRAVDPLRSASTAVVGWQKGVLIGFCVVVIGLAIWQPVATATSLIGLCTLFYVGSLGDRLLIFRRGLASGPISISDERARAVPDSDLPMYTILVPAYNEPEVVADLIGAMAAIEYPAEKMQVLLLLEADDDVTINAAEACKGVEMITIVLVPPAEPRTKPKACNYGLHLATGEIVTIYDAEDLPDPLQLRRAVLAFADGDDSIACVQAKLAFHNGRQNLLTGWFTNDYGLWFGYLLPGLMRSRAPIPLGGTSNHLRRSVLREIGAWDPFNVTEDADLGVRIAETGYRTAVIDSVTLEEANSDPINWIRQRSRWYKGYLQTWLVHVRRPVTLWKAIGAVSFIRFTLLLAGTPVIACLNLVFWFITVMWFLGQPAFIGEVFPWYIYFPALVSLIFGNGATIYMNLIAIREDDRPDLLIPALTVPIYWVMMSIASAKGCYQLIRNPSYWEKTFHGLSVKTDVNPGDAPTGAEGGNG